jgi:hypothetical protein
VRALLVVMAVGCGAPHAQTPEAVTATPREGIAIAIYANGDRSYAVVDDRRRIAIRSAQMLLDRIDPAASLQSLLVEPLDARDEIHVTACARERVDDSAAGLQSLAQARGERPKRLLVVRDMHDDAPERFEYIDTGQMEPPVLPAAHVLSPVVQCTVTARAGDRLVRIMHVTSAIAFRTVHELTLVDPDRAQLTTRFAIATPAWATRAEVTLFEGIPGDEVPPRELVHGTIVLDGSTAILDGGPTREVPAHLRTIYDGAKIEDSEDIKPNDIAWARESRHQVWEWLEVTAPLASGTLRAHVELPGSAPRDVAVEPALRQRTRDGAVSRFPLWIDDDLVGTRKRTIDRADGVIITDRLQLTIANIGDRPREVWIEEPLRPAARRRTISQPWPGRPQLVNDLARVKLTLAPGHTERMGFTMDYEF